MKGSIEVNEQELRETVNDLPLNVKIISCTLDELAENCSIITKEKFITENLEKT